MCRVGVLKIEVPPDVVIVLPLKQRGILIQAWRNWGGVGGREAHALPNFGSSVNLSQPGGADYATHLAPGVRPKLGFCIGNQN